MVVASNGATSGPIAIDSDDDIAMPAHTARRFFALRYWINMIGYPMQKAVDDASRHGNSIEWQLPPRRANLVEWCVGHIDEVLHHEISSNRFKVPQPSCRAKLSARFYRERPANFLQRPKEVKAFEPFNCLKQNIFGDGDNLAQMPFDYRSSAREGGVNSQKLETTIHHRAVRETRF